MQDLLSMLFTPTNLTPHGFCLLWEPGLIWLQAVSDGLIGIAYFSIPLVLLRFVRHRPNFEFKWIVGLFAGFILACGTTHFLSIVTLWTPFYWLEGMVKAFTALISAVTAVLLWPLLPRVLALPSPAVLERVNAELSIQIQERDRSAATLREREVQLRQAQKMEGLGQLAGGIAHDFNNVLQVVSGGLTLIHRRAGDADTVRTLAGMAGDAAARGALITGRLLAFTRSDSLQGAALDTAELVESTAQMLRRTLNSNIEILTSIEPATPPLLADRRELQAVLVNLALNARDAMPKGGTLTLSASVETIALGADLPPGTYIRLTLADTGIGMEPATLARAGDPFFTTKALGKGIGIGLGIATARSFALHSDGKLALRSVKDEGTDVTLWLPEALPVAEPHPLDPTPAETAGRTIRLLLVDDDQMVREVLVGHLLDLGVDVTEAASGAAALTMFDAGQKFDVLVSDFSMPDMDGLVLIEEMRKRRPDLPAMLLTGYADEYVRSRIASYPEGYLVLLHKPIQTEELVARAMALLKTPKPDDGHA